MPLQLMEQQVILSSPTRTVKTVIDIPIAVVETTNTEALMATGIEATLNSKGRIPDHIINTIITKDEVRIRVIDVRALVVMTTKIIINNIIIKVIIEATSRTITETSIIEGEVDKWISCPLSKSTSFYFEK